MCGGWVVTTIVQWGVMCGDHLRYGPYPGDDGHAYALELVETHAGATLNGHPYRLVRRVVRVTEWRTQSFAERVAS